MTGNASRRVLPSRAAVPLQVARRASPSRGPGVPGLSESRAVRLRVASRVSPSRAPGLSESRSVRLRVMRRIPSSAAGESRRPQAAPSAAGLSRRESRRFAAKSRRFAAKSRRFAALDESLPPASGLASDARRNVSDGRRRGEAEARQGPPPASGSSSPRALAAWIPIPAQVTEECIDSDPGTSERGVH